MRLARGLAWQRPDAVGRLQALPVRRIGHLLVGRAVDRVAQFDSAERALRNGQDVPCAGPHGGARNAVQGPAGSAPRRQFQQRTLALAQHHEIERPQFEHQLRTKRSLHAARHDHGAGRHAPRQMREFEVEAQGHARGRDTDDVPAAAHEFPLQRALRCITAAIGVEHPRSDARRLEDAR